MYEECLTCKKLGISCDGPNFLDMSTTDLLEWCKARKSNLKISNESLAERSGVPKGTIDRLFSSKHYDFKYETIRPLLKVLVGDAWGENPCHSEEHFDERAEEKIKRLEEETAILKDNLKDEREDSAFLKEQLKYRQRVIATLSGLLTITTLLIIIALIIDRLNHDIGFFWVA